MVAMRSAARLPDWRPIIKSQLFPWRETCFFTLDRSRSPGGRQGRLRLLGFDVELSHNRRNWASRLQC